MRRMIVVGRPNVGKTLFCLSFAEFLGMQSVNMNFVSCDRGCTSRTISLRKPRPFWQASGASDTGPSINDLDAALGQR